MHYICVHFGILFCPVFGSFFGCVVSVILLHAHLLFIPCNCNKRKKIMVWQCSAITGNQRHTHMEWIIEPKPTIHRSQGSHSFLFSSIKFYSFWSSECSLLLLGFKFSIFQLGFVVAKKEKKKKTILASGFCLVWCSLNWIIEKLLFRWEWESDSKEWLFSVWIRWYRLDLLCGNGESSC